MNAIPGYNRDRLLRELIRDEDERFDVYRCTAGRNTIGVGRNLDDVGISAAETQALGITVKTCFARGITKAESRALLANDVDACERALDRNLPWWRELDGVRQRVLLNMCFNLGIGRLLGFRNTLARIKACDWRGAAAGMKASAWHSQVGARALRLEAMMLTGETA